VAINDALPLKAARCDAVTNLNLFEASDTTDLTLIISFTFAIQCCFMWLEP